MKRCQTIILVLFRKLLWIVYFQTTECFEVFENKFTAIWKQIYGLFNSSDYSNWVAGSHFKINLNVERNDDYVSFSRSTHRIKSNQTNRNLQDGSLPLKTVRLYNFVKRMFVLLNLQKKVSMIICYICKRMGKLSVLIKCKILRKESKYSSNQRLLTQ